MIFNRKRNISNYQDLESRVIIISQEVDLLLRHLTESNTEFVPDGALRKHIETLVRDLNALESHIQNYKNLIKANRDKEIDALKRIRSSAMLAEIIDTKYVPMKSADTDETND